MNFAEQFAQHIRTLQSRYEETLKLLAGENHPIEAVFLHSGSEKTYFADDEAVPFRAHGHFRHWAPVNRPDQAVLMQPGKRPTFYRVQPKTFWCDTTIGMDPWWADAFDPVDAVNPDDVIDHLPPLRRIAFIGENTSYASRLGFPSSLQNLPHLRNRLDSHRSLKTPYEIDQVIEANRKALRGHEAARLAFEAGESEYGIHRAYVAACGADEVGLPFPPIVTLDETSAILHYQHKRREPGTSARLMMCDAGDTQNGYASDITRAWLRDSAHPIFHELLERVTAIKDTIAATATAGTVFKDLNEQCHGMVTDILLDVEVIRGDRDELIEKKVSTLFLPHGLGHLLGLNVHDVGGLFKDETGVLEPPPEEHKSLRLTRTLENGMIYTVEPGIYFMPMLLEEEREKEKGGYVNYDLVEELIPLGGVRMEDDVVIEGDRPRNLTAAAGEDGH